MNKETEDILDNIPDWEQRRYEIAKQMMATIYLDEGQQARNNRSNVEFEYQDMQSVAHEAVRFADALCRELINNPNPIDNNDA